MTTTTDPTTRAQSACIVWISDPGHAWLAVSLDLMPEAIEFGSEYSYIGSPSEDFPAGLVFLEEDCDAPEFVLAHGIDLAAVPESILSFEDNFVRDLPRAN